LRQKDAAKQLRVNECTLCGWENNKTTPTVQYFPRIIDFLGYDPLGTPQCLGEAIAAKRRDLGLSRKRLATQLSMDEMSLARYEEGAAQPKPGHQAKLEEFLAGSFPSVSKATERSA
jgi:transcriptional regulator with XRE-family HTH domain